MYNGATHKMGILPKGVQLYLRMVCIVTNAYTILYNKWQLGIRRSIVTVVKYINAIVCCNINIGKGGAGLCHLQFSLNADCVPPASCILFMRSF